MAAASDGLRYEFVSLFNSYNSLCDGYCPRSMYVDGAEFGHFIEVPIHAHIEFPACIQGNIERRLETELRSPDSSTLLKKAIVPLYYQYTMEGIRTADSMLKKVFAETNRARLVRTTNGNGNVYYCNRGLILDKDFKLLCGLYLTADFNEETQHWDYGQPILKVSSFVFENPQEFMAKAIIQKIIPLCVGLCNVLTWNDYFTEKRNTNCKVVIDNYDNMIIKSKKPSPNHCSDELLNQVLVDNLEDVMSLVS